MFALENKSATGDRSRGFVWRKIRPRKMHRWRAPSHKLDQRGGERQPAGSSGDQACKIATEGGRC